MQTNDSVGKRLCEERKRLGFTQKAFAGLASLTTMSQHNYESGVRAPDSNYLAAIAAAGADVGYIVTGVRSGGDEEVVDPWEEFEQVISHLEIFAAAGPGVNHEDDGRLEVLAFRKAWLKEQRLQAGNLSAIRSSGDSMEPTIQDGDTLLVDHSKIDPRVSRGGIYVLRTEDGLRVKRLSFSTVSRELIIASDNTSANPHPERIAIDKIFEETKIIGKVVWIGRVL